MAFSFSSKRYENTENAKFISERSFYLIISAVLFFGFIVNALEVVFLSDLIFRFVATGYNLIIFYIGYFVLAIVGVCMNIFSRNPVVSFIGYCLVVLPIGALLALVVPSYSFGVVRSAFIVTSLLAVIFGLFAVMYPRLFYSMWRVLAVCLVVALIWALVAWISGSYFSSGYVWLDWLLVLIFCCYIGFDIALAKNRPKTLDNAIDSACGLYLDLINVFLRLLVIFGRND